MQKLKPKNKGYQTLPDKRGKVKQCNPERSFPCGKACLSITSDILGRCQKNLIKNTQNQALKLLYNLKNGGLSNQPPSKNTLNELPKKPLNSQSAIKELLLLEPELDEINKQIKKQQKVLFESSGLTNNDYTTLEQSIENLKDKKINLFNKARELLYVENPATLKANVGSVYDRYNRKETGDTAKPNKIKEWENGLNEFNKLIGVPTLNADTIQISGLKSKNANESRSFFIAKESRIVLSDKADTSIIIHEIGHYLESKDSSLFGKVKDFYNKRTANDKIEKLKDITSHPYGNNEITKKDKWIDPYMGKIYSDGGTEILSMGLEYYYHNPIKFAKKDPEYFEFIYNAVRGI